MRSGIIGSFILLVLLGISLCGGFVVGDSIYPYSTDPTTGESTDIYTIGIDLHEKDTSQNGLSDYDEIYVYGTNPMKKDTTGDGLSDYDEVMEYGTDPTKIDSNDDGVSDAIQLLRYGGDPLKEDTNQDGVTDKTYITYRLNPDAVHYVSDSYEQLMTHSSITTEDVFSNYSRTDNVGIDSTNDRFSDSLGEKVKELDPDAQNIIVKVEYMNGVEINVASLLAVREAFNEAPGEEMNLIYQINTTPVEYRETITDTEYREEYYPDDISTHHLLFADEVRMDDEAIGGFAITDEFGMVVGDSRYGFQSGVVMHEIGHSLGLAPDTFDGIDSTEYSTEEYNSVMNYSYMNEICGKQQPVCTGYSSSGEFNDWEYIQRNLANNNPQLG